MDILFVATELAPFVKVGGLGDVVAALGKALRLLGHRVTVALPRFAGFERGGLMVARRLTPLTFQLGASRVEMTVFDGKLASGVEVVLLDVPGLYDRAGIYGEDGVDYPDNARRFALFARGAAELARQRAGTRAPFDVLHAHDWPAALAPYYLRELRRSSATGEGGAPKSVLTLHNLAHQGLFPRDVLPAVGLDEGAFHPEGVEFFGQVSFLKAGILAADQLTTVSTTYAHEILTPERGEGLDGVLRSRAKDLVGIVHGIDYAVYNPAVDPALAAHYDAEDAANKGRCRTALLRELDLELAPEAAVIVSVGRVVPQKGSDVLAAALPKILREDAVVVVCGEGDPSLMHKLDAAVTRAEGRAAYLRHVSEAVVHRMLAAADLVLIPSRYEPCGLVQLYAHRYGALPVAHATGGLVDTIVDCDAELETGTGFLFDSLTPRGLVGAVQRALTAFRSPRWPALRRRVMRRDVAWDRPARRYDRLYRTLSARAE